VETKNRIGIIINIEDEPQDLQGDLGTIWRESQMLNAIMRVEKYPRYLL